ncbi:putative pantetheine-phosphate adenylyltransferase [Heterostelium album PN500]|uniref:Putative pantetheine-phosphate adenylyltransferase n=1 Tax=Heterostelium pallidum (strain ATCC 26659 / Pp 5 / PN500) TaxID=670386 RepID=D3BAD2_HETP5|nr:putative pantetheine-phosphate adenylyltransferase [Heterostelium album PN500]EFA81519.1 putative pantetheine-phosphate adenylyltransferase [Heterostelium album PN500]|eukprot:XP_020433636.1 putative pantetheine-phosphate adenylyltransferase [Heterostelium album PN500]
MYKSGLIRLLYSDGIHDVLHHYNIARLNYVQKQVTDKLYVQFIDFKPFCKMPPTQIQYMQQPLYNDLRVAINLLVKSMRQPNVSLVEDLQMPVLSKHITQLKRYEAILDTYYKVLYGLNMKLDVTIMPHIANAQLLASQPNAAQPLQSTPLEQEVDAIFVDKIDYDFLAANSSSEQSLSSSLSPKMKIIETQSSYPTDFYYSSYDIGKIDNKELFTPPFKGAVLGGTFDRIHPGHKVLLSMAALLCSEYMEIGVTDNTILKSKKYSELIAPFQERSDITYKFMKHLNPYVEYNMLRLLEPYANTKVSNRLEVIIVSPETKNTALHINEERVKNNLKPLEIYEITYFDGVDQGSDFKLSSSYLRELDYNKLQNNK